MLQLPPLVCLNLDIRDFDNINESLYISNYKFDNIN